MSPRSLRPWLLAGFTTLAACSLAPLAPAQEVPPTGPATPAAPSVPPADNELYGPIKLPAANLDLMLLTLEELTGRTVLRPPALPPGDYNLVINRRMPKAEAIMAIETVLAMNQVGIAPLGDKFLKVVPLMNVRMEAPEMITGSTLEMAPSGRIASKVYSLDFLRVSEFMPQIANMLNPQLGGPVIFDKTNAFMLTDSVSNLQRIERLLLELDQPITANLRPKFYPLSFAKASDVVNKLRTVFQGPIQQQLGSATSFSPDDRTNQIILLADPRQHPFFDDLIARFDVKADPNTRNEVIQLKHATAKDVQALVAQLVGQQNSAAQKTGAASVRPGQLVVPGQPPQPAPGPQPEAPAAPSGGEGMAASTEFSSLVSIIADERSNAVVVSGTVDDIRLITDLIQKLDVLLAQVRIEVVIAEITLGDESSSGIDSLGLQVTNNKLVGFSGGGAGLAVGGSATAEGSPTSFATIGRPGGSEYTLSGILNLTSTPRKNNANILSVPNIVTTHNKEARIFVGESRPVISSYLNDTSTGGGTDGLSGGYRSTVSSRDIGIELTVKPLIGNDGSVQLEIKQKVEDVIGNVTIDGNEQPNIGRRETESFVSVNSGEIVVLGGLQRNSTSKTANRLGPIPIIGDLLGSRSNSKTRTDLVFFLRPYVLTNTPQDNVEALNRLEGSPNRDAVMRTLDPKAVNQPKAEKPSTPSLRRPK